MLGHVNANGAAPRERPAPGTGGSSTDAIRRLLAPLVGAHLRRHDRRRDMIQSTYEEAS
jgi:hypothetical protein